MKLLKWIVRCDDGQYLYDQGYECECGGKIWWAFRHSTWKNAFAARNVFDRRFSLSKPAIISLIEIDLFDNIREINDNETIRIKIACEAHEEQLSKNGNCVSVGG